ncbi:MAG TPA: hypothetical protein VK002_01490 [Rubricoccaceae bacterium]|nr:hypothetical protein [Rubricoccaceae bacterium]
MLSIAIYLVYVLLGASILIMLAFGIRNLGRSGENKLVLAGFALPIVLAGVLMAVYGSWVPALIMTAVVLMLLAFLLMILSAGRRFVR